MSSATSVPATPFVPHCIHVVGLGRTGAAYVEALLRTGEIEDQLLDGGARFAALVVDIGDDDTGIASDYAVSFKKRLESRGIPADRFHFEAVSLPPPSETVTADFAKSAEFLKGKAAKLAVGPIGTSSAPATLDADGHAPRALAKAIYADAYYGGERPLDRALSAFAQHVQEATHPSLVLVCFSLAGGVGGGMAIDLSRHLGNAKLDRHIPVIGVGQLPSSGDPADMQASPRLYATLNDLDCMLDTDKNEAVVGTWGESYRSPFTGGFFVVNPEQSWQRLTAYTTTGEAPIRQRIKQTVTNRFVADSFMRLVVVENGHDLVRALRPSGLQGASDDVSGTSRHWTLFNIAKLTHPGVQVLPGEPRSKWSSVIAQWVDFAPKWDGLTDGFKTDYAEIFIYASRNMEQELMTAAFKNMVIRQYLIDAESTLKVYTHEFFDTLTAYANIALPGVAKTDLTVFWEGQKLYDALTPAQQLGEHAWIVDSGVVLPAGSAALAPASGSAVRGATCWNAIEAAALTGKTLPPPARKGAVAAPTKLAS